MQNKGLIISNISNLYMVEDVDTKIIIKCNARGKLKEKNESPVVGDYVKISIGLSRLFFQLTYNNIIKANKKSTAKILIISMLEDLSKPAEIATRLRNNGINTQIYVEKSKIKKQFKYANNLEIPYVIVLGEDEINNGTVSLKNMQTGEQTEIKIDELCENPSKYLID